MVQNFFNFFNSTMFWLIWIPLYEEFQPLFVTNGTRADNFNQTRDSNNVSNGTWNEFEQNINETQIFNSNQTNTTDISWHKNNNNNTGIANLNEQTTNTTNLSVYKNRENETGNENQFVDIPDFNVNIIYYTVYSPNGIAVQLLQNFFVWLTSSLFWLYFTPFYTRWKFLPSFFYFN
jgi:hypothetical protein